MMLCLDSGNTRLKWGLAQAGGWLARGTLDGTALAGLVDLVRQWPGIHRILLVNVAGEAREEEIARYLGCTQVGLEIVHTGQMAAGVVNGYREPERLGVDRWCALVGARWMESRPCLVVLAGTATTVDSLDGTGRFLGGMILPGLEMMRSSLARGTAQLPLAVGRHEDFPLGTDDGILTGCLEAQAGAVERAFRRLPGAQVCLLSGGAAEYLEPLLGIPVRRVDNLVLEGLLRLACVDGALST